MIIISILIDEDHKDNENDYSNAEGDDGGAGDDDICA